MQILASLEIAEYEVRLLVGEFHESRFNMLHLECVPCEGIVERKIVNASLVEAAIKKALDEVHKKMGYRIYRVLLLIPTVDFARVNKRVNVYLPESTKICKDHIDSGLAKLREIKPEGDYQLVNMASLKFITNGIASRKVPLNETADKLAIEADLLFANQEIVFDYVGLVERCNLEVLDICLDAIAIAEEAAVLEQSLDTYVITLDLERESTNLSLFYKGSLVNSETLPIGYQSWANAIAKKYGFKRSDCYRLLNNCLTFHEEYMGDSIVHLWQEGNQSHYLSEKELCMEVMPHVNAWIATINDTCSTIVTSGKTKYVVTGSGVQVIGLQSMERAFNAEVHFYIPQTIGARNPALSALLGIFYSYDHPTNMRRRDVPSVDVSEVTQTLQHVRRSDDQDGTFTKKLKKIFNN